MNVKDIVSKAVLEISENWERALARAENHRFVLSVSSIGPNSRLAHPNFISGAKYMTIGKDFASGPGLRMECIEDFRGQKFSPELVIGGNVIFNYYCHVGVINKITLGNNVLIGSHVLITDHSHGVLERTDVPFVDRRLESKGEVIIGDNVWIGENACIMPGVRIGAGSIIGANSVVTHDVPPYSLCVGVPAKIIRHLDS
jgi:acetyltransferase-like isoleucine patch superfamily enzyme